MWPLYHLYAALGLSKPLTPAVAAAGGVDVAAMPPAPMLGRSPSVVRSPLYAISEADDVDDERKGAPAGDDDAVLSRTQHGGEDGSAHDAATATAAPEVATTYACSTCKVRFESLAEQRAHFRLPWHVANVRRAMQGRPVLDEAEATAGVGDLDDELSASSADELDTPGEVPRVPRITVTVDGGHRVTLFRAALEDPEALRDGDSCSSRDVMAARPADVWVVLMFRSGHFAAAVFQEGCAIVHKCFHRYVALLCSQRPCVTPHACGAWCG